MSVLRRDPWSIPTVSLGLVIGFAVMSRVLPPHAKPERVISSIARDSIPPKVERGDSAVQQGAARAAPKPNPTAPSRPTTINAHLPARGTETQPLEAPSSSAPAATPVEPKSAAPALSAAAAPDAMKKTQLRLLEG